MKKSHNIDQIVVWNKYISDGDEKSLSILYFTNYDLLFDYGTRMCSNIQLVEDAIQDVFISIIKYRNNIGDIRNVKSYLVCSFRRQLIVEMNKQRKMLVENELPENFFDYFLIADSDKTENSELMFFAVCESVNSLTNKQREILHLRFQSELSYEEIAQTLNITVDSCYKSVYRTVKTLRIAAEEVISKNYKLQPDCNNNLYLTIDKCEKNIFRRATN